MSIGVFLTLFTLLCSGLSAQSTTYQAGERVPFRELLGALAAESGYSLHLPAGIDGEVAIQREGMIYLQEMIDYWLPRWGFFCYRDAESQVMAINENLSKETFRLTKAQSKGLLRAATALMEAEDLETVSHALRVLFELEEEAASLSLIPATDRRYLFLFPDRLEVCDSRFVMDRIRNYFKNHQTGLAQSPPLSLDSKVFNLQEHYPEGLLQDLLSIFFGGGGFIENHGDGTPSIVYYSQTHLLVIRQTPAQLIRIERMVNEPRYNNLQPHLQLVRKEIRVAPEGSDRISDVAHRQLEVERMTRIFEVVLNENASPSNPTKSQVIPNPESGTITVVDTEANIARLEKFLEYRPRSRAVGVSEGNGGVQIRVIEVKHRAIDEMARALQHIPFIP